MYRILCISVFHKILISKDSTNIFTGSALGDGPSLALTGAAPAGGLAAIGESVGDGIKTLRKLADSASASASASAGFTGLRCSARVHWFSSISLQCVHTGQSGGNSGMVGMHARKPLLASTFYTF